MGRTCECDPQLLAVHPCLPFLCVPVWGCDSHTAVRTFAYSNKKLLVAPGHTTSNKKLLGTSATLVVTGATLLVTRSYERGSWPYYERSILATRNKDATSSKVPYY